MFDLTEDNELVTTFWKNSKLGAMDVSGESSCATPLKGFEICSVKPGPVAGHKAGTNTTDPGCLHWIIDGGIVRE